MPNIWKSILTSIAPQRGAGESGLPKEWAIAAGRSMTRAMDGNFSDVFSSNTHGATFLMGEVSASGARAATLINLIRDAALSADQEAAAHQLNRALCEQDRYATAFWSQFNPETKLLHFINAGHVPPLLFKANRRPMVRLNHAGPGLGVFANAKYRRDSVAMDPGDILVMYADGIVEANDHSDENFGEDRLTTVVELARNKSVREIRNRILSCVQAFSKDTAAAGHPLLVIRYAPVSHDPDEHQFSNCASVR